MHVWPGTPGAARALGSGSPTGRRFLLGSLARWVVNVEDKPADHRLVGDLEDSEIPIDSAVDEPSGGAGEPRPRHEALPNELGATGVVVLLGFEDKDRADARAIRSGRATAAPRQAHADRLGGNGCR